METAGWDLLAAMGTLAVFIFGVIVAVSKTTAAPVLRHLGSLFTQMSDMDTRITWQITELSGETAALRGGITAEPVGGPRALPV